MSENKPNEQQLKEAVANAAPKELIIISNTEKTANKTMKCQASEWLKGRVSIELLNKMTDEERESVRKARKNNFMIVKGDKFIRQRGTYDGKSFISKFLPAINDICSKYNLYTYQKPKKDGL